MKTELWTCALVLVQHRLHIVSCLCVTFFSLLFSWHGWNQNAPTRRVNTRRSSRSFTDSVVRFGLIERCNDIEFSRYGAQYPLRGNIYCGFLKNWQIKTWNRSAVGVYQTKIELWTSQYVLKSAVGACWFSCRRFLHIVSCLSPSLFSKFLHTVKPNCFHASDLKLASSIRTFTNCVIHKLAASATLSPPLEERVKRRIDGPAWVDGPLLGFNCSWKSETLLVEDLQFETVECARRHKDTQSKEASFSMNSMMQLQICGSIGVELKDVS